MTIFLRAQQLCIGYKGQALGSAFDIQLTAGQVIALLGPNGSGKTTLLKTLLGLLAPVSGQIHLLDKTLSDWPAKLRAQHIGYVPQAVQSHFSFSVFEMVLMGRSAYLSAFNQPGANDQSIALECLEQLQITHLATRSFAELSGGEQQLVMLARALAQQPKILILDEPTASLDFANQILVLEHINQLRAQGLAILISTHQPEHALQSADYLALFKQGTLTKTGTVTELGTADNIAWLYDLSVEQVEQQLFLHPR
ncbi:ABC transporter ATP-binding protein [Thiopseudomonas acetoxidans]|uniref:ABC transporter ATP-binding protein n=1 Tax=Thiopseudomonas acetoxidans TaxID=3041622 RepID=A0ABT7SR28_9GAMM|nr:ABC transporter ATP-binding protein [Thiopseudomonas sp. CY1220]MDM7858653.1 ABC transporter ATP-binding protein [Thiopseudomonas sp. CY1220]